MKIKQQIEKIDINGEDVGNIETSNANQNN